MMAFAGVRVHEKSEKQENVADVDTLVSEMRLRGVALPENALSIDEHRIVMAEVAPVYAASGDLLDEVSQTYVVVGRDGVSPGRDWHADGPPGDNGRREPACGGIESLPAEHDLQAGVPSCSTEIAASIIDLVKRREACGAERTGCFQGINGPDLLLEQEPSAKACARTWHAEWWNRSGTHDRKSSWSVELAVSQIGNG
jgi:hypothetical protein